MSDCSASDRFAHLGPVLRMLGTFAALGLILLVAGDPAEARLRDRGVRRDTTRIVRELHVNDHAIVVVDRSDDSVRVVRDSDEDDDQGDVTIHVDDDGDDVVRVFDNAHVAAGEHIHGSVVAVFGSVDVDGVVDGDVVAVMGSVRLTEHAEVAGEVVSVGGSLDQAPGATVKGESVSVSFMPMSWGLPGVPVMLGAILAGWLASVALGWLFAVLFPTRFLRVAVTASRRTAASLLLGLLSIPASFILLVLLFVTVIGIPLALVLPPACVLLAYAGQMAATYVLGCKLMGRPLGGGRDLLWPMLAGSLIVAALFGAGAMLFVIPGLARPIALFFALLGMLLVVCLTIIGTGAFLLSRFGSQPRDVVWGGADPIPAPPAPFPAQPSASSSGA